MCYKFVIYIHFLLFWIHSSIQNDNLEERKSNVEMAITNCKQHLDGLIKRFRTKEKEIQDVRNEINMELSTEHQSIDQYMMCRSKLYQSIEQKILMGELINEMTIQEKIHGTTVRNSDIMKKCFTEEQSVYTKHLDGLIESSRTKEKEIQDVRNEINMELSTEHQSIDQCMLKHELIKQIYLMIVDMMCRSKLYQSTQQKILMGELINEMTIQEKIHGTTVRNSDIMKKCFTEEQSVYTKLENDYRNENCQLPNSNNIRDNQQLHDNFRRLDGLLRDRYGRIRVCNIYLFSHDILQTIHKQIDNQLKKLIT
ncbi:unnamed protein product [Schistosoma haematobium]|nr:unnamed protein product [Schistosoma haematobium]